MAWLLLPLKENNKVIASVPSKSTVPLVPYVGRGSYFGALFPDISNPQQGTRLSDKGQVSSEAQGNEAPTGI